MAKIIQHPEVDVVVMGLGVVSGAVAAELSTKGHKVVGIEKGPYWQFGVDFAPVKYDEWGIQVNRKFDHPLDLSTYTLRNNRNQYATPMRRYTPVIQNYAIGHGVGGAAQHFASESGRFAPWSYKMYSETVNKYGLDFLKSIAPHQDLEDWPMTYEEYIPYYETFEEAYGVTGTNEEPFIPNSNFPLPPHPDTPLGLAFKKAAEALGYHPYPIPTLIASKASVNQYGIAYNECAYDGWCGAPCNYQCETGAKSNSAYRTIPAAVNSGNFDMALNSYIYRMDFDAISKKVTAVRYFDAQGNIHVQPGKAFFNGTWGHNIIRLALLSGIGTPYNPVNVTGSVGRGIAQISPRDVGNAEPTVSGTLDMGGNAYPAGNAIGGAYSMMDLADDNFDHTGLDFIGGAGNWLFQIGAYLGGGPANLLGFGFSANPQNIGSGYKATWKDRFLPTKLNVSPPGLGGPIIPVTDHYVDLDPHHTDLYGDPLARLTQDVDNNTYNAGNYLAPIVGKILEKMGCTNITVETVAANTQHMDPFGLHIRGGYRLGKNPDTSVLNKWQQCWECENLFAAGEICDTSSDNVSNGTHVAGSQAYVAAEGVMKYLQSSGPLV